MHKTSLFRAYCDWPYEVAVYVEAHDRDGASFKIAALIGALYGCTPDEVSFYNLDSYFELIEEKGIGADLDLRIFECGWCADEITSWVERPLFLAPENRHFLLEAWSRLQCKLQGCTTSL